MTDVSGDSTAGWDDLPAEAEPQDEAKLPSAWRRIIAEGGATELALAEAASLLGASVETVKRRIKAGKVRAFHDARGRIRINTIITYTPEEEAAEAADAATVAHIWAELRSVRDQLEASRAAEARLREELEAAETALEYTKAEVGNLWRVMTTRNLKQAARKAVHETQEGAKLLTLAEQRMRIRQKINSARTIARRRKWPWSLVS